MSTTTVEDQEVNVRLMVLSILLGILASIGAFALTYSVLAAIAVYVFVACATFAVTWVIGSGS